MDKSVYDYLSEKYGGQWRDVVGYEGLYCVSSDGRVASLNYHKTINRIKLLKQKKTKNGYMIITLGSKSRDKLVHRLVAIAFIPNPDNKPYIDHINTIKDDNRIENLRWCTLKENQNNPLSKKKISESHKNNEKQLKHIKSLSLKLRKQVV